MSFQKEHNNHNIIYFGETLFDREELLIKNEKLKNIIVQLIINIEKIKNILNKVMNNIEIYYKIIIIL